jgi:hypothetical protein
LPLIARTDQLFVLGSLPGDASSPRSVLCAPDKPVLAIAQGDHEERAAAF